LSYNAKWSVAVALALFFGHGAFWVLFGMEILQGTHTFSKIAVTLAGFHLVTTATRDFGIAIAQLDHAIQDYKYLEQFHTTQPFIDERDAKDVVLQRTPLIEMCSVSFCYPRMSRRVLDGCSFTIAAGDNVAFAGRIISFGALPTFTVAEARRQPPCPTRSSNEAVSCLSQD
jgi:ABC-type transport system involved in cytochrome bd biosynthesis fused ATPase/permease subunit